VKDNIKIDPTEIACEYVNVSKLVQNKVQQR